ncbi:N-acetylglucosaminylphosphatidylinositol deacetylase [Citrus sinensis]|uniref:N-acetylglucosaminylphosphatidylinositol deacetylase n=1 Tax=Citrus sinensis TaxID=2711 RepID=A0ACB8KYN2_CITSI|nr:N-acetylglucosaminylphosphatidylinositol deacetylase [Citrus sinensis]KAH9759527.1 N-acetylglucosaminylphosphatidylinositol deacetylase [Citrus sinensis]
MCCWLLLTQMMNLCNADGMGNIRKDELHRACAVLKIPLEQVKVLDLVDFQDGFDKLWNHKSLAKIVEEEVVNCSIDLIITFDNYGVSGHCNHRDVHHGIWSYLNGTSERNIEAWELMTTNILRKYSGPLDIWLSILSATQYRRGQVPEAVCIILQLYLCKHPQKD